MTFLFSCEVGKSENTFSTTVSRPQAPPHEWLFFPYIRGEIQKHVFDKFRQISPFRHISTNFAFFDKFRQLDRFRHHFSQIRHHFSQFRHHFSQFRHHFSQIRYISTNFSSHHLSTVESCFLK